jgi:hypothetical protein
MEKEMELLGWSDLLIPGNLDCYGNVWEYLEVAPTHSFRL